MKKKIFSLIFISFVMILSLVGGTLFLSADSVFSASTDIADADGSDHEVAAQASGNWADLWSGSHKGHLSYNRSTVYIYDEYDLMDFMCQVNDTTATWWTTTGDGGAKIAECNIELEADLDMSAHYWNPIGTGERQFRGYFDGNGHTISGLYIDKYSSELASFTAAYEGVYGIGLFGVSGGCTIRDLTLSGGYFRIYTDTTASIRMGGLVGMSTKDSSLYVHNVINNMSYLEIYNYKADNSALGGIVGCNYKGHLYDTFNFAKIIGRSGMAVGGIVGTTDYYCDMDRCGNFGEIYVELNWITGNGFGGIVGAISEGDLWTDIIDCVNYGSVNIVSTSIQFQSNYVGGIIGYGLNKVYINRCINYGSVKGTNYVGGIAGKMGNGQVAFSIPFLWWDIPVTLASAKEDVGIANCINYGEVKGSNTWGKICGEMNGAGNIQGCYTVGVSNRIGAWKYADGTDTKDYSCRLSNIDYWEGALFTAAFYREGYLHGYNFSGSIQGHQFDAWNSSSVHLNGGSSTGWTVTTLLYDYYGGSSFGLSSAYPYSLVPSSLIGAGSLATKYYRSGRTEYDFEDDDSYDLSFVKVTFNTVGTNNKASEIVLGYDYATFYYVKGLKNSTKNSLKIYYHTDNFTFSSATLSSLSLNPSVKDISYSAQTSDESGFNRAEVLSFTAGTSSSTVYLKAILQSKAKTWSSITQYTIGTLQISDTRNNYYRWETARDMTSLSNDFFTVTRPYNSPTSYYYKEEISSYTITPQAGYSILYVLKLKKGDTNNNFGKITNPLSAEVTLDPSGLLSDDRSMSANVPKYTLVNGWIRRINPYSTNNNDASKGYGTATVKTYNFIYGEKLVVYAVPTWYYYLNLATFDMDSDGTYTGDENSPRIGMEGIWLFQGGTEKYGSNSRLYDSNCGVIKKNEFATSDIKMKLMGAKPNTSQLNISTPQLNYKKSTTTSTGVYELQWNKFVYGYEYSFYAYRPTSENAPFANADKSEIICESRCILSNVQPDANLSFEFNMKDLFTKGIKNSRGADEDRRRSGTDLYLVIVRKKILYTINYVTMANSYTNPNTYQIYSDGRGGVVETESSKVGQSIAFANNVFPGYEFKGSNYSAKAGGVGTSLGLANGSNFESLLNDYLDKMCGYNVNDSDISSREITIYVYYQLKKYILQYEIEGASSSEVSINITSTNPSNASGVSGKNIYYFAPTTIEAKTSAHLNFLGWFVVDGSESKLLSLNQTYKFLAIPSVVKGGTATDMTNIDATQITKPDGTKDQKGYWLTLVAKYARYDYSTASVPNAGSGKVLKIRTADDLVALSSRVRNGESYEDTLIQLENDIDMSSKVFSPIGTKENPFKGIFDGQNHIISNLDFINKDSDFYAYEQNLQCVGLFGYTNGATIRNLTIKDSDFTGFSNTGIFVANATNTKMSFLNNYNCNLKLSTVDFYDIYKQKISGGIDYTTHSGGKNTITKPAELSGVECESDAGALARVSIGGLVGEMSGSSSVYACSVNAGISMTEGLNGTGTSNSAAGINALVGKNTAGTIDQSCVENSENQQFSLTNNTAGVTNCYYRKYNNTVCDTTYYISPGELLSDKETGAQIPPNDAWFNLANGLLALKVLYWH